MPSRGKHVEGRTLQGKTWLTKGHPPAGERVTGNAADDSSSSRPLTPGAKSFRWRQKLLPEGGADTKKY
jgi:hypothetical protein